MKIWDGKDGRVLPTQIKNLCYYKIIKLDEFIIN